MIWLILNLGQSEDKNVRIKTLTRNLSQGYRLGLVPIRLQLYNLTQEIEYAKYLHTSIYMYNRITISRNDNCNAFHKNILFKKIVNKSLKL